MNKTKKLTQGAMMIAIIGALIGIDRITAYWFSELIVLMMPVVIIMYCAMYSFSDAVVLSVGLLIISFLLGNFHLTYLLYVPAGIITGLAYSYGLSKNLDRNRLLFISIITYVFSEVIISFVVYPLIGFPIATVLEEFKTMFEQSGSVAGISISDVFSMSGFDFSKVLVILYIISVILMGLLEGVLIHLFSIFMLKRFKIKDLGRINIFDIKPNKTLSYVCFLSMFSLFFINNIKNEILYYLLFSIAVIGALILFYYGYLFLIIYGRVVLKRNVGAFIMMLGFFMPPLLSVFVIVGFLYGAGPLRTYLESKVVK